MTAPNLTWIDSPEAAEYAILNWMQNHGYPDARATRRGADHGLDISSTGAVAQVRWRNAPATEASVRDLSGARRNFLERELFFFSATGFTSSAVDWADDTLVALFKYNFVGGVLAQNNAARRILSRFEPRIRAWERQKSLFEPLPPENLDGAGWLKTSIRARSQYQPSSSQ